MTIAQLIQITLMASIFLMVFSFGLDAGWEDAMWLFRRPGLFVRSILSMNVLMVLFAIGMLTIFDVAPGNQDCSGCTCALAGATYFSEADEQEWWHEFLCNRAGGGRVAVRCNSDPLLALASRKPLWI